MPKVSNVEAKIERVERFPKVAFFRNGVNVKGNMLDMPQYPYSVAASSSWTVGKWRKTRFFQTYPGYEVRVYLSNGSEAPGNMALSTVRGEN